MHQCIDGNGVNELSWFTSELPSGEMLQDEPNNCGMRHVLPDDLCELGCSEDKYGRWSCLHIWQVKQFSPKGPYPQLHQKTETVCILYLAALETAAELCSADTL